MSTNTLIREGDRIRVAVLQANIEQEDKWNPALSDAIFDRYLTMSRRALADRAEFVIWPESSTPFYLENDPRGARIRLLAQQSRSPFLIGSDQIEPVPMTANRLGHGRRSCGAPDLQCGVSGWTGRHDVRRVSEDPPRALWRATCH